MGWIITLGILFLLAILPLGVSVRYNEDGTAVKILAGPIPVQLLPGKKKEAKPRTKEKQQKQPKQEEALPKPPQQHKAAAPVQAEKKGGSLLDFLPLVKVALSLLNDFRRKLRVNRLEVKLVLAGDDPCDLATNCGKIWVAIGTLMPKLEKWLVIKKRNIDVQCDFTADETLVTARLDVTITLGRLLALAAIYAVRALKEYLKIKNNQKGGAVK